MSNKKIQVTIKGLLIRCRELNISLVFITQSYFSVPKYVFIIIIIIIIIIICFDHYLIMKINNRKELQNIASNHSAYIDYNDFVRIYREYTRKSYSFLTIDTALPASDPLRFRKYLFPFCKNDSR